VGISNVKYPAYPNCLPTARYLKISSLALEGTNVTFVIGDCKAMAAALKCSMFFPTRRAFRTIPRLTFVALYGAITDAG